MEIAVLKESKPGENRVALTPDVVKTLVKKVIKYVLNRVLAIILIFLIWIICR